jgi:hypothetical protein
MKHIRLPAALAAAGLISAGLVSATAHADAAAPRAERAAAVQVSIDAKHVITMPTTLPPGISKFVVSSVKAGAFQLVTADPGYTPEKAAADINAAFGKNDMKALKRFENRTTLLGGVSSPAGGTGTGWMNLPTGTVWALDTDPQTTDPAKIVPLTVTGTATGATLPAAPTLKTIKDTTWANKPASIPAKGILRFKDRATNNHFIVMAKLAKGKTVADFAAWVDKVTSGKKAGPPPLDNSEPGINSGVLDPGESMALKYHVSKGKYVLTCFWPDVAMGGLPHAFMGMFRGITVK